VKRIAKVTVGVAIVFAHGRGGHTKLKGRLEVFEYLAPITLVLRASSMALIDNHQIEEVARIFFIQSGPALVFNERLINSEIHFASHIDDAIFYLPSGVTHGRERFVFWIVDDNISISRIKYFR